MVVEPPRGASLVCKFGAGLAREPLVLVWLAAVVRIARRGAVSSNVRKDRLATVRGAIDRCAALLGRPLPIRFHAESSRELEAEDAADIGDVAHADPPADGLDTLSGDGEPEACPGPRACAPPRRAEQGAVPLGRQPATLVVHLDGHSVSRGGGREERVPFGATERDGVVDDLRQRRREELPVDRDGDLRSGRDDREMHSPDVRVDGGVGGHLLEDGRHAHPLLVLSA
jgi:hypothetical protein